MEHHDFHKALLVLFIVTVVCFSAELEAVDPNSKTEQNNTSNLSASSTAKRSGPKETSVDQSKKKPDQVAASQGETKIIPGKNNSSKEADSKEVPKVRTDEDHSGDKSPLKEGAKGGSKSRVVPKDSTTTGDSGSKKPPRKETARGEECDSSSKCTDDKNKLIACLRVPGSDSAELSLLIQNKGTSSLTVKISASDYVYLENNSVVVPEKEDKKVKVSIGKAKENTLIVLTTGGNNCSIDFRDLIPHNSEKKANGTAGSADIHIMTKVSPRVAFISIIAVVVLASVLISVKLRRMHLAVDSSKYQKLETELPVSSHEKKETDGEDGWDESWGDSWDDEEAPKTPSMPITPSLSSKGLASRKLTKDAWKD